MVFEGRQGEHIDNFRGEERKVQLAPRSRVETSREGPCQVSGSVHRVYNYSGRTTEKRMDFVETLENSMNISDRIRVAENKLSDARRYLETGEAVNWVPNTLSWALESAMEAWLIANRNEAYQKHRDKSSTGTVEFFFHNAPPDLRSPVIYAHTKTTFLEYDLMGSSVEARPVTPMDLWKRQAWKCLEIVAEAIRALLAGIDLDKSTSSINQS